MKPAITAIGTANPQYKQFQAITADLIINSMALKPAENRLLKFVYKATGILERHSVLSDYCKSPGELEFFPNTPSDPFPSTAARMQLYKDNALGLALTAIQNCLAGLKNFAKSEITHLITVSCTGMYAPGLDIEIVQQLHLNTSTKRTAVNFMGCYGAFNAIKIADAICKSDAKANVLIVSVELCTIHFQKSMDIDNIIANSIFADGAAAVLVQATPKQPQYLILENFHNDLLPQTQKEMAWHIGDNGFDIRLSTYVPEIIQTGIADFMNNFLNLYDLKSTDIDLYAIHPGGIKILEACESALNITKDHNKYSYQILRHYGNMSSATVLFVLKALWEDIKNDDHQKNIFSCAFGPGLTLEAMMLKVNCT
ncbi:MAG: type III polyketide synthase [Pseudomonadota bacterium]